MQATTDHERADPKLLVRRTRVDNDCADLCATILRCVVAGAMIAMNLTATRVVAQPMEHEMSPTETGTMTTPLGIPETRDASGTSWQPESTPMFMWHWMTGGWSLALAR
jgi:hypothetical protein